MIHFGVRRLPIVDSDRRYHLFDDQEQLLLVADYNSPWLANEPAPAVRLARPDGDLVATMDMTNARPSANQPDRGGSYAIIYDYAVYAIITQIAHDDALKSLYLIEVEGERWLALTQNEDPWRYALYDRAPARLDSRRVPEASRLAEPVGFVRRGSAVYDYTVELPAGSLRRPKMLSLALVFLIDNE
jgi:hypothetical protein